MLVYLVFLGHQTSNTGVLEIQGTQYSVLSVPSICVAHVHYVPLYLSGFIKCRNQLHGERVLHLLLCCFFAAVPQTLISAEMFGKKGSFSVWSIQSRASNER